MSIRKLTSLGANVAVVDKDGKPARLFLEEGQLFDGTTIVQTSPGGVDSEYTLADGELERLERHSALVGPTDPTGTEVALKSAEEQGASPAVPPEQLDLAKLGSYDDATLAALWERSQPKVSDVIAAVGDDAALAQKALTAESGANKGDIRVTLQRGLDKVLAAGKEL